VLYAKNVSPRYENTKASARELKNLNTSAELS
jgi:hypothetical protein